MPTTHTLVHVPQFPAMVREHMSPVRRMMSQIAKDRIITKFPQAFHPDASPYQQINFSPQVKEACQANKTGNVGYVFTMNT